MKKTPIERPAKHGEKMIVVEVRFWTNGIAKKKNHIVPKHAWWKGVVYVWSNESHGIKSREGEMFRTGMELPLAVEKALAKHGVKMQQTQRRRGE